MFQIKRSAPFFSLLAGKVRSYLSEKGDVLLNEEGDLAVGEVVSRKEHLNRLKNVYERIWQAELRVGEKHKDEDEISPLMLGDAHRRLSLLKRGRFLCPVDREVHKITLDHTRVGKTFFGGRKIVENKVPIVRITEYDRRMRQYIYTVYQGIFFGNFKIDKRIASACSPDVLINVFIHYPATRIK